MLVIVEDDELVTVCTVHSEIAATCDFPTKYSRYLSVTSLFTFLRVVSPCMGSAVFGLARLSLAMLY